MTDPIPTPDNNISKGLGAEPDADRKRYCVEVPLTLKFWIDADSSDHARQLVADRVNDYHMTYPPESTMTRLPFPPPSQCWAGDDLKLKDSSKGPERLRDIFRLCFAAYGPHLNYHEEFEHEAWDLFDTLDLAEQLQAHGAFAKHGIEVAPPSNPFQLPRAYFGGDWSEDVFCGYNTGCDWNGHSCPLLTRDQVDLFIKAQHDLNDEEGDPDTGTDISWLNQDGRQVLQVIDRSCPSEAAIIVGITHRTADGHLTLFDIGLGFTWSTFTAEEIEEKDLNIVGTHHS